MLSVDHGAVAEYRFASELLARGILPVWPSSNMYPYDMIGDTGKYRHRIQVKGTNKKTAELRFEFRMIEGKKRRAYTKVETDFLVLYSFHWDVWWIIPVKKARLSMTFKPGKVSCKYNIYVDAWHLLR